MSIPDCVRDLRRAGKISKTFGDRMLDAYTKQFRQRRGTMGHEAAEAEASDAVLRQVEMETIEKERREGIQISRQQAAFADMAKYRGRNGKHDEGRAAEALLARDDRGSAYRNVEYADRAIRQSALGKMAHLIETHGRNLLGQVKDKAGLIDIVKEGFGIDTGNPNAKALYQAWADVAEELRLRANAAGAAIGKLADWRFPQSHDPMLVRLAAGEGATLDASFAAWRAAELPRLDRAKMMDHETGLPLDDAGLDQVLRTVFDNIVSDGWASRTPGTGGGAGGGVLATRMGLHRVMQYKDGESFLASQAQYGGTATIYDAMMGYIAGMSRDIALMERLGPNPAATVRLIRDTVRKDALTKYGAGSKADEASFKSDRRLQDLYDTLAGNNRRPESRRLAVMGSTLRQWQVAAKLGSAVLSTTSDFATSALARRFNGLPMSELASGYAKYLNPANEADRMHAARMGFIAEQAGSGLSGAARMMADELSHEVVSRLAEGTMRLSGLNAVTEANRLSFGHSFMAQISRDRALAYDALDPAFRGFFDRYGMGAEGWDAIRATPVEAVNGADWIVPEAIANKPLADRLLEAIYQEMDVAVPTSGVAVRAGLDSVAPKGTWRGEAIRSLFQFKAFPVTLMMVQWQRAMAQERGWDRLAHFSLFFGASALAGAMALQMKEIAKGRDPRPMGNGNFLMEAIAQGGGAGIYGDFVRSTDSRFGSGPLQVIGGPAIETLASVGTLTVGNAQRAAKGEDTHVGRDLATLARSNTPVIGSLFWTRLAFERAALDSWRRAADPMAPQAFARMERKYQRDYGQDYWWGPGDAAPDHAPRLGEALDTPPAARPSKRGGW